jgi:conjugal transfer mating pair stabilization protein TraG
MNMHIYVLGDVSAFVSALNSVAMVLGVNSFITGAGLLGAMIGLIAFCLYMFNREAGASILPGGSPLVALVVFFLFFSSIQIKSKVTIEDAFTGNAAVVDGVPVLISLPSTIITTTAYKVFSYSNTAYQSTSGSFMSMGQTGFVQPLKVLMSLREGIDKTDPLLAASLRQYIIDCTLGTNLDLDRLETAPDALGYILSQGRSTGMTVEFTTAKPSGEAVACLDLQSRLQTRAVANMLTPRTELNNRTRMEASVNKQLTTKTASGNPISSDEITDAVQRIAINSFPTANQNAQQFMLNTLIYNTATNAFGCLDKAGDMREFSNCDVMLTQAYESWKVDSSGQGTLFTKTMLPAMVFLQLMFYTLAPIVIAFALVKGASGMSMYIKYLGFGVWTMSWLPVAAGIQMYIQNNVQGKLQILVERALTFGNFKAIYADAIGTNLALASDMLAATPLVTATILGVSAMAMTSLTSKMGGMNRTDDQQLAPDLNKAGAFLSQGPTVGVDSALKGNMNAGLAKAGQSFATISSGNVMGNATESALGEALSKRAGAAQALGDTANFMKSWKDGERKSDSNVAAFDAAQQKNLQIMKSKASEIAHTLGLNESQKSTFEQSLNAKAGLDSMFGGVNTAFKAATGRDMTKQEAQQFSEKYSTQIAESDAQTQTMRRSAQSALENYRGSERGRGQQLQASLTQSFDASASADANYRNAVRSEQTVGSKYDVKENELGYAIQNNSAAAQMLAAEVGKRQGDAKFQGAARSYSEDLANKGLFRGVDQAGQFRALVESASPEDRKAAARIMETLSGVRGVQDTNIDQNKGVGAPAQAVKLQPSAPPNGTPANTGVNASSTAVLAAAGGQTPPGKPIAPPLNVAGGSSSLPAAPGAPQPTTPPVQAGTQPGDGVVPSATPAPASSGAPQPATPPKKAAPQAKLPVQAGAQPAAKPPATGATPKTASAQVQAGGTPTTTPPAAGPAPAQNEPPMPKAPTMPQGQGFLSQDQFDAARGQVSNAEAALAVGRDQIENSVARLTPEQMRDTMGLALYKDAGAAAGMKWDEFKKENPKTAFAIEAAMYALPVGEGLLAARGAMAAVKASRATVAKAAEKVAELSKGWATPKGGSALTHAKVPDAATLKQMGFKSEEAFLKASKAADEALLAAEKASVGHAKAYVDQVAKHAASNRGRAEIAGAGAAVGSDYAAQQHEIEKAQRAGAAADARIAAFEADVKARYANLAPAPAPSSSPRQAPPRGDAAGPAAAAPAPANQQIVRGMPGAKM